MNPDVQKQMPSTHWSLIKRAGLTDAEARRQALGELLARYWKPMFDFLARARRIPGDQAEDLLQGFVSDKIMEGELFKHADSGRGKFRSFLIASLDRYAVSQWRKSETRAADSIESAGEIADPAATPDEEFDASWARSLLTEVLKRMEAACKGREAVWGIFKARVLPEMLGEERAGYETLIVDLKIADPRQAANLLVTAKRTYVRILREVVGEYEGPAALIDEEINDLRNALSRRGAA
jgi:DNA-directed RNA polymerase specialized sigma24 family protein